MVTKNCGVICSDCFFENTWEKRQRALNFKLKACVENLKAALTAWKKPIISYSYRADMAENQAQCLMVKAT